MNKILMVIAVCVCLCGCTTTQCAKFTAAYDAANTGYLNAQKAGMTAEADKYKWAADSAAAMVQAWCGSVK